MNGTPPLPAPLTRAALRVAAGHLAERDRDLRRLLETHGPPPLWGRPAGFQTLVRIILEQQVSLASARAMFDRLRDRIVPLDAGRLAATGARGLRRLGVTRQKAAYCVLLAETVRDGGIDLARMGRQDDEAVVATLTALKGVGPWTAAIYLLMALRRPDVWPIGDIALQNSARRIKRLRPGTPPERIARLAESWRPYRSVAARMLWQDYLARRDSRAAGASGAAP